MIENSWRHFHSWIIYWCSTDIDEARVISFLGVRTDRHVFWILKWKHVGTQKISTQSTKLGVSCRSLYASPEDGDALLCLCRTTYLPAAKQRGLRPSHCQRQKAFQTSKNIKSERKNSTAKSIDKFFTGQMCKELTQTRKEKNSDI